MHWPTSSLSPQPRRYSGAGLCVFHIPIARNNQRKKPVGARRGCGDVLDEVDQDERVAGVVEERDLTHHARSLQQHL